MPAATWTRTARDIRTQQLTNPREFERKWWNIAQVVDHTGLSEAYLRDTMARQPEAAEATPRGALMRPAGRIGLLRAEPYWSPEQITEYDRRRKALADGSKAKPGGSVRKRKVPQLSAAAAREKGLVSVAELADELGCPANVLRRYSRDHMTTFPPVEASAERAANARHGRQHQLRDRAAMLRWLVENASSVTDEIVERARVALDGSMAVSA